jgi:hypothetical protein
MMPLTAGSFEASPFANAADRVYLWGNEPVNNHPVNPIKVTIEALGWYGAVAILGAYAAVSFGWLGAGSLVAISLNLTGAFGVILVSWSKRAWQPVALNGFWLAVAAVSLARYFWVWGS